MGVAGTSSFGVCPLLRTISENILPAAAKALTIVLSATLAAKVDKSNNTSILFSIPHVENDTVLINYKFGGIERTEGRKKFSSVFFVLS